MDQSTEKREALLGQRGCVVWITGLSGSGKTTLALALEKELLRHKKLSFILDGDNIRDRLNTDLGFSADDRAENVRRISEVGSLFADAGIIAITSFISPFTNDREKAKNTIGTKRFIEVYLSTEIETCEARDVKGLYKKARAGEIPNFTGIGQAYEAPTTPDLEFDTAEIDLDQEVAAVISHLTQEGFLS